MKRKFKIGDVVNFEDVYDIESYTIVGFCDHHEKPFYVLENFPYGAVSEDILSSDFYQTVKNRIDKTEVKSEPHGPRFRIGEKVKIRSDRLPDVFLVDLEDLRIRERTQYAKVTNVYEPRVQRTEVGICCHYKYRVAFRSINWNKQDTFNLITDLVIGLTAVTGIVLGGLALAKIHSLFILTTVLPSIILTIVVTEKLSHFIQQFKARYVDLWENEVKKIR